MIVPILKAIACLGGIVVLASKQVLSGLWRILVPSLCGGMPILPLCGLVDAYGLAAERRKNIPPETGGTS